MNIDKENTIFDKLCFAIAKLIAIFTVIGVVLSCSASVGTTSPSTSESLDIKISTTSISTNQVTLFWEGDHQYRRFILSQDETEIADNIAGTNAEGIILTNLSYTVGSLNPNTEYTFSLEGCNGTTCSKETVGTNVITRPMEPREFNFVRDENTSTSLSFTWEAPAMNGASHYTLYQGNNAIAENIVDLKESANGLDPGISYTFGLVACNVNNLCSTTNEKTVTTPPGKVTDLKVSDISSIAVTISWVKPETTTSYVVSKQEDGGAIEEIAGPPSAGDSEFTIGGLTAEISYTFSLQACNDAGCSEVTAVSTTTAPNAPGGLTHESVTSTTAGLKWDAVVGAKSYIVYRDGNAIATNTGTPPATTYTAGMLTANTPYTFSVSACVGDGSTVCTDQSDYTFTTAPVVPANLTVGTVSDSTIELTWEASTGATYYVIDTGSIKVTNSGLDYIVMNLNAATGYTLTVVACNAFGCSLEATVTATTAPDALGGLTHESVTSTTADLRWDAVTGADFYIVYRDGDAIATNTGTPPATTYTAGMLTANTPYTFSVSACVGDGSTVCTDQLDYTLTTAPVVPANLTVGTISTTTIGLTWEASAGATHYVIDTSSIKVTNSNLDYIVMNLNAATGYTLTVVACNAFGCSLEATVTTTTAPDAPGGLTHESVASTTADLKWDAVAGTKSYIVYRDGNAIVTNTGTPPATMYTAGMLTANTPYTFSVSACVGDGSTVCTDQTDYTLTTAPVVPANFRVGTVSTTIIGLTWEASAGATYYVVDTGATKVTNSGLDYTVMNLNAATGYTLTVVACNAFGCSLEATVTTTTAPDAPGGLTHESVTSTTADLKWDAVTEAKSYIVYRDGDAIATNTGTPPATTYTAGLLTANTPYTFSVSACVGDGSTVCTDQADYTFTTAPVVPANFRVGTVTTTTIGLIWEASAGATYYVIDTGSIKVTNSGLDYTVMNLNAVTGYTLTVVACNAFGCSLEATVTPTTAPDAPENFTNGSLASTTADLKWDAVTGAKSYIVYRDGSAIATNTGTPPATTYTAGMLTANTPYTFSVLACIDDGFTVCTDQADYTLTTAPMAPQNLVADAITSASVTLSWDAVAEADEYVVYIGDDPVATNATTTHIMVNLRFAFPYSFSVRACNSLGCSDPALKQVTTLEAPDFFTITYPNMDSTTSDSSSPIFISSEACNILVYTLDGQASYSIDRTGTEGTGPVLPTIDPTTGEVKNNGTTSPGTYQVTVTVPENADCSTNVLVYNAITLANKDDLTLHLFGANSGIALHGNDGNYNYIDTSKVETFQEFFKNKYLFNGDISEWDTSQSTQMDRMFWGASAFNQPIGSWDTSKVTNMNNMFRNATTFNQPIGGWDTSQVKDMSQMFLVAAKFNHPLGDWNTSQVANMKQMFYQAKAFNQPLSNWNTSQVSVIDGMFWGAIVFDGVVSNWDISQVNSLENMFRDASSFNQPLNDWDTSKVKNMDWMFSGASIFDQPLSNWNTSLVQSTLSMFRNAAKFNQPLRSWNTAEITDMSSMFNSASTFDQDLSMWDVGKVTSHYGVFTWSAMQGKTTQYPDPTWTP